jgi:two-component sensor histidine kinase
VGESLLASLVFWNPIIAAAFAIVFFGTENFVRNAAAVLVVAEVAVVLCFGGMIVGRRVARRVLGLDGASPARDVVLSFVLAALWIPASLPVAFGAGALTARVLGAEWGPLDSRSYRLGLAMGLLFTTLFFLRRVSVEAVDDARAARARAKELENARLRAQLSALTAEMNPHLLFNALNTVASLVHDDPDRAEEVVLQLSELYRGVLRSARAATHPLSEELRLCEAYLRIEHARFGQRLAGEIVVDPSIDVDAIRVPVLVLQPFVENAVQHGLSQRREGGKVSVELRLQDARLDIVIEDDGVGFGRSMRAGAGKAISNCRERLALSYGDRARLELGHGTSGGARVVVSLPLGSEDAS